MTSKEVCAVRSAAGEWKSVGGTDYWAKPRELEEACYLFAAGTDKDSGLTW